MRKTSLADLRVGDSVEDSIEVRPETVQACLSFSGDDNPVHFSPAFASAIGLRAPIAHGLVQLGLLSKLIGTMLPGPGSIWSAIDVSFTAPVHVGEHVTARVTVKQVSLAVRAVVLEVSARVGETSVLRGSIRVRVPDRVPDV